MQNGYALDDAGRPQASARRALPVPLSAPDDEFRTFVAPARAELRDATLLSAPTGTPSGLLLNSARGPGLPQGKHVAQEHLVCGPAAPEASMSPDEGSKRSLSVRKHSDLGIVPCRDARLFTWT